MTVSVVAAEHVALVLRNQAGAIIDIFDLADGEIVTSADMRALLKRHHARSIERITTTEYRRVASPQGMKS